jgi:hypothetical protein
MQNRQLRVVDGSPTIYLIDEYHHCKSCIDDNIVIAKKLFQSGVVIAGVEGYEGGMEYDEYDRKYKSMRCNADISESTRIGDCPDFAKTLHSCGLLTVGVDCRGLANEIEVDVYEGRCKSDEVSKHPNQFRRSEHFIRTLLDEVRKRNLDGDLILNCGSNHNEDIEKIVSGVSPLPQGWPNFNYVRIRSDYFHDS